ncbi:uncharacterized protein K489DRAFT_88794 [Dissoconium aciculare CBS 342.82]|uniref:Uncharacterized protein n=1 Tax=Dissoconium aciculare CBS 342.82 TaxID=1314786 RepID=A0A6J3LVQ3_9PEZI|nr:uncharacterized protein K489DRAFT_88794 [Dissoconium aciculare CBS 342.82]KAF1818702.1 hypothetical protein K489DRAFT_88794 [Dissoconium aciculare CBS 342.82]
MQRLVEEERKRKEDTCMVWLDRYLCRNKNHNVQCSRLVLVQGGAMQRGRKLGAGRMPRGEKDGMSCPSPCLIAHINPLISLTAVQDSPSAPAPTTRRIRTGHSPPTRRVCIVLYELMYVHMQHQWHEGAAPCTGETGRGRPRLAMVCSVDERAMARD